MATSMVMAFSNASLVAMERGEHSLVIIVVILLGDLDDLLGGALEQILAVGVRSQNGAIAWQGQADGLGQAVHRIRGEHAGAGTQVGQTVFS